MSDYDSDALAGLDPWLGDILAGLSPAKRKRAATKLGQALRRSNLAPPMSNPTAARWKSGRPGSTGEVG